MKSHHAFELIQWLNHSLDDPCFIAAELDEKRWEVRKLEIFPDGTVTRFILENELAELPWPSQQEISGDEYEDFLPLCLTAELFEELWIAPSLQFCNEAIGQSLQALKPSVS
ncbi:DUF6881 domain-containing protein [Deinococcus wulumuqiensis]|uniref:DUF6881 domain-containing protein n=1 Tax=Deinococcus wulumuqiensis TaxID=980427 RepID=UPI0013C37156|nr:hypothetical protein [Deinococcus wulumuqiensis]